MNSSLSSCHSDLMHRSVRTFVYNFPPQGMDRGPEHEDSEMEQVQPFEIRARIWISKFLLECNYFQLDHPVLGVHSARSH